jgi:hypothetical protein
MDYVALLPVVTTILSAIFATILWRHWNSKRDARYLMWWAIGVTVYGLGTFAEGVTGIFGWSAPVFRLWYISGALLGGWPLAQGSVYLLMKRKTANLLTTVSLAYITFAAIAVLLVPVNPALAEEHRLSGVVMEWHWVRLLSPFINTYAVIFLIGGALWSAWRYWRRADRPGSRVLGNVLIAVGAVLPGVGGSYARAGMVGVLYVTELIGLTLIWSGYAVMRRESVASIHAAQAEGTPAS